MADLKYVFDRSPRQFLSDLQRKWLNQVRLREFDDEHPCLFILSTGRVGTETMASLFSLAKNILAYHELAPRLYGLSKLAYELSDQEQARKIMREAFTIARKGMLDYSLGCGKGYVETSPQVTFLAPFILDLIPNARFIHLVRDPRDVVRSGMRRKWFDGNSADKTRITPLRGSDTIGKWDHYTAFQKNLWLWAETNRWIKQFCSTIPSENVLFLRSEDIFSSELNTVENFFKFIGAPMPSNRKIHHLLGKKLNAQKTGEFPTASIWTESMNSDLTAMTGDVAQSFGYILSTDS